VLYKVAHLTSVHSRYDTRIFIKECSSLAKVENYDVSLVVADSRGHEVKNNIHIYDVGKLQGRLNRMRKTTKSIFQKAVELNSDIYHLHDPELIPIGLKLKKLGKKVVFDAHEDLPKQIRGKPYLNPLAKKLLADFMTVFEHFACRRFDAIITATPTIREKFLKINRHTVDVNNYPILNELHRDVTWDVKKDEVCYVGGISEERGAKPMINAMSYLENCTLTLAGTFSSSLLRSEAQTSKGWQQVNELGYIDRSLVAEALMRCKAGLVLFLPLPNHIDAQPNKMFEYMSVGIPVISANYPLWRQIIEQNHCGICVNPRDSIAIADAIRFILQNPKEAEAMGKNGKKAVESIYNWEKEEEKLLTLYEELYQ